MSKSSRIALFFALLGGCAALFTYLTAAILNLFLNTLNPSPTISAWSNVFVGAIVLFTCALFLLVLLAGSIKVMDWLHFHRMLQKHREVEYQWYKETVRPSGHNRLANAPHIQNAIRRSRRFQPSDRR